MKTEKGGGVFNAKGAKKAKKANEAIGAYLFAVLGDLRVGKSVIGDVLGY